ncbi:uncharacterized membrane protein HdeD (DUF308 family) [Curtobacterium sp. PhB130]|nr:uncharacterized membrane protein HdeD (DUF308 family) [Curtobacterium sp. PhB130]
MGIVSGAGAGAGAPGQEPVVVPDDAAERRLRIALAVVGVVAVLAGVTALVLPHATVVAVVWVFGIHLVVSGGAMLVRAVAVGGSSGWRRIALVVVGLLVVAGGVIAILHPPVGIRVLVLVTGFAWALEGIALLYAPGGGHRGLTITAAVLSVLGGVLLINVPALGTVFAVAAVSCVLVVFGVVQLVVVATWSGASEEVDLP